VALVLAIDVGTSNLKVGLVDSDGELLILRKAPIPTISKEPGSAEHNPAELKRLILELSQQVLLDEYRSSVESITLSTYHFGLLLLDKDRTPITGISLLTDIRAQRTFSEFKEEFSSFNLYERTGCPLLAQYVLPRLFYFSKKSPELLSKARYFAGSKDFLFEWLTGEFATDTSIATATQVFNVHKFNWDEELLAKLNLEPNQFPKIVDGTKELLPLREDIRSELGLNKGTKVLAGLYDGGALAVGLGGLAAKVGVMNVGTTAMFRVPSNKPAFDSSDSKRLQAYALCPGIFLNGGALNNAALPLDWLRAKLFDVDLHDPSLLEINNEPPLFSLPYLTGERDSKIGPFASGVFFGIRRDHGRIDFARSLLEGVCYSMRNIYEALQENDIRIKELRMGGGGTSWKVWPQMFADILGMPILIPTVKEVALVGSAMSAFTATGTFKNLAEASRHMVKAGERVAPNLERTQIHAERYEFFKKLRAGMGELYKDHALLTKS